MLQIGGRPDILFLSTDPILVSKAFYFAAPNLQNFSYRK